jgi:acyl-CoA reductase-like NAD-dependent aldehyde dehydrogenase
MRKLIFFVLIITLSGLIGCATGAERAAEADADFKEERLKILRKYQKCVDQHKGDLKMLESCEHYLKAIDAMK